MSLGGSRPEFGERAEYGPNDVCYRHPDSPSFTLCQRCGRTICAQCQTNAPVGVLCPECMRELRGGARASGRGPGRTQNRAARKVTVMGRRLAATDAPVVTYGIMIACVVVWVAQLLIPDATRALWFAPAHALPQLYEPWRFVTAMFTHSTGSIFHILFNMLTLWLFGRNLEQLLGRLPFFWLYIFSGVGGSIGTMLWAYADPAAVLVPTVGASGAIFGVMGATLVAFRAAGVSITSLAVLIAINVGIGFLPGNSVSWQAHLGGLAVGALTMWILVQTRGPRRRGARIGGLIGLGAVLIVLTFAYFVVSPLPAAALI